MLTIVSSAITGILCLLIGYFLSRWQKHREILYAKKIDGYSFFTSSLLDFRILCNPSNSTHDLEEALKRFPELMKTFNKTRMLMPKRLSDDINSIFFDSAEKLRRTVNDGSKSVAEIFNLSVSSAIVTIRPQNIGLSSFLPGPFEPIFNKTDNIIDMLKADLGIEKMSGKFYARFRKIRE